MKGKKKQGRYSDATESLENELSLSTGTPRPAPRCRGEHSDSSACVMTGKKNDLLTSLPPLTLPPSLHRRSEQGGESTSILPVPGGAPLKDKTTTIRLRFPASCRPFSRGYVHRGKKINFSDDPATSVFTRYQSIRGRERVCVIRG